MRLTTTRYRRPSSLIEGPNARCIMPNSGPGRWVGRFAGCHCLLYWCDFAFAMPIEAKDLSPQGWAGLSQPAFLKMSTESSHSLSTRRRSSESLRYSKYCFVKAGLAVRLMFPRPPKQPLIKLTARAIMIARERSFIGGLKTTFWVCCLGRFQPH